MSNYLWNWPVRHSGRIMRGHRPPGCPSSAGSTPADPPSLSTSAWSNSPLRPPRRWGSHLDLLPWKVWFIDLKLQHYQGAYSKCRISDPTQTYWIRIWRLFNETLPGDVYDHASLHLGKYSHRFEIYSWFYTFLNERRVDGWLCPARLLYLWTWPPQGTVSRWRLPPSQGTSFSPAAFLFSVAPSFSGKPLTLNCTARFGFEINFNPVIKWYIRDSDQEWEIKTPKGRR